MLTEDEVRQQAKKVLNFNDDEQAISDTGQLTTFNQLGDKLNINEWKGISDKPDGWYLPKNPTKPALILEAKSSDKDLEAVAADEVKKNMLIALKHYQNVMGITYNGKDVRVYRNEEAGSSTLVEAQLAQELQDKEYYIRVFTDRPVDVNKIYNLTSRINNTLHFKFGIKNLYDRMIFTAGALVAVRYGATLHPDDDYDTLQTSIISKLNKSLEPALQQNLKLNTVIDVFRDIQTNFDPGQDALRSFVENVNEISKSINSSHWRGEDVMAIFFNEFNRYKAKSDNGQVFTPQHIANFMYRLIGIDKDDSVLDGTCGSGTFLTNSMSNMITAAGGVDTAKAKEIMQHQLYGIEFDKTIFSLACANMMIHKDGKTNLALLDAMTPEAAKWIRDKSWTDDRNHELKKYHITKVLMNPPYERKYKPIKILNNVLDNVPKGTDAAILLPDHKLEKETHKDVKQLLEHNQLLKIIKLPKETFSEGVSVSIFIFKTGQTTNPEDGIFTCEIKSDGLETVKNQGRQDVNNKWPEIEDFWVQTIKRQDTNADESCQWITPDIGNFQKLSYPTPLAPFEIFEEDFKKTAIDYLMYEQGIDFSAFSTNLTDAAIYNGKIADNDKVVTISVEKGDKSHE